MNLYRYLDIRRLYRDAVQKYNDLEEQETSLKSPTLHADKVQTSHWNKGLETYIERRETLQEQIDRLYTEMWDAYAELDGIINQLSTANYRYMANSLLILGQTWKEMRDATIYSNNQFAQQKKEMLAELERIARETERTTQGTI